MEVIAFIGRAGSGKDYQCSLLEDKGYKRIAFADALRDIAYSSLGIDLQEGLKYYEEMKADAACITVDLQDGGVVTLSFRQFLEWLGTQAIRKYVPDFWVQCLLNTLKQTDNNVCISDMRFVNEYWAIQKFCDENNYNFKCIFCDYKSERYQENNNHESARLANYFAQKGYSDLSIINKEDIKLFEKENR